MADKRGFFYPLIFPFYEEKWFSRTWWLALIALIPVFNLIIFSGWRFALVRNMAEGKTDILPEANPGKFFLHGLLLWSVAGVLLIVPMIIIFTFGAGPLSSFLSFFDWIFGTATQSGDQETMSEVLSRQTKNLVIRLAIDFAWAIVSVPILRTGLARFAATGKILALFDVPTNAIYTLRYIGQHFSMWVFKFFLIVVTSLITAVLTASIVFTIVAPSFALCVYYWSTGYELGHFARQIRLNREKKASRSIAYAT